MEKMEKIIKTIQFLFSSALFIGFVGLIFYTSYIVISTVGINISNHGWKFIRYQALSTYLIKSSLTIGVLVLLTFLTSIIVKRIFNELLNMFTSKK